MYNDSPVTRLPVTLTLANGEKLHGVMLLTRVQKLFDAMNRPELYLDFETRDGEKMVIAKSGILSAAPLDERKARTGTEQLRKPAQYDAHEVLGLAPGAPDAAIRPAYVEKARLYHPDQFAGHPLPPEVSDYLKTMFILVQRAYDDLSSQSKQNAA